MTTTAGLQLSPKQQLQEQNIFQASQVFSDPHTSADAPQLSAPAKPLSTYHLHEDNWWINIV